MTRCDSYINRPFCDQTLMKLTQIQVASRLAICTCVAIVFASICWGQSTTVKSISSEMKYDARKGHGAQAGAKSQDTMSSTVTNTPEQPIITINGLCNDTLKGRVVSPCRTVISRAEFEHMIGTAEPKMSAKAQREFAERYADALVMAHKAEQLGLNRGVNFEEEMKLARIQILSKELKKTIEKQASQISEDEVESYYSNHRPDFEQVDLERVHVPRYKDGRTEQSLASDPEAQRQLELTDRTMKEVADKLRERAISGDDLDKLQKDAFDIAGTKGTVSVAMGKIRRVSLPQSHKWVMGLNSGEVSPVIADSNGFTIYKIKAKEIASLDQVRAEIKGILHVERVRRALESIQESASTILDDSYFRGSGHE